MIVDQFPELERLSLERKLVWAAELFEDATDCTAEQPDPEIIKLLVSLPVVSLLRRVLPRKAKVNVALKLV